MESGTALAARAENPIAQMERAWPEQDREKLAQFLSVKADDPAFIPFLALAQQLDLNPFMGEIWLIETKQRAKNGAPGEKIKRPAVGRDGLLKHARRRPDYIGFQANVVCAGDAFDVGYTGDLMNDPQIHHVQHKAADIDPDTADKWRGRPIGAWCKVYMRDRPPVFYYAPITEHGRFSEGSWGGAWNYTSAMILKAAVAYAHRIATGVSGFVPVDELREDGRRIVEDGPETEAVEEPDPGKVLDSLDIPEELKEQLDAAIRQANELAPFSWGASKIGMRLGDAGEDRAKQVLEEIREQIAADRKAAEMRAEAIQDAIVVLRAEDVQPHSQIRKEGAAWKVVEDVVDPDDGSGVVTFVYGDSTETVEAGEEFEVRNPSTGP